MTLSHRTLSVLVGCSAVFTCSALVRGLCAQESGKRVITRELPPGAAPAAPPQGAPPTDGQPPDPKAAGKAETKPGEKPAEKAEPARARRKPAKPAEPEELKARLDDEGRVAFSFKGQDWEDVLEWFADISNTSLQMEEVPPGFLNLTSRGRYTVGQIQDLINSALMNKGYTMVRNGDILLVSKLEKLDKSLVPRVDADELDDRGTYEFVKCFFDLKSLIAETTAEELKPMLSPTAKITALKTTNRLDIVETAGNLRRIRDFLAEEQSERGKENVLREFKLKNVRASEVLDTLHTVLGLKKVGPQVALTADQIGQMQQQFMQAAQQAAQAAAKGGAGKADNKEVFLAINKVENSILANAPPDKMTIIEQAVKAMDIPKNKSESLLLNLPRLRSYKLSAVDPLSIVRVLEDLGNLDPQTRLEVDARSRSILAYATPIDHITIQAIVDKIDGTGRKFEVIQLYVLEAEMVAGSIEFLMRGPDDKNKSRSYNPFFYEFGYSSSRGQQSESAEQIQVEADSEHNRLLIRATEVELKEIRQLLAKLGEVPEEERGRQTTRVVPMSPADMQKLIERIRSTWPSVAPNPLKIAPVEVPVGDADEDESSPPSRRRTESRAPSDVRPDRAVGLRSIEAIDGDEQEQDPIPGIRRNDDLDNPPRGRRPAIGRQQPPAPIAVTPGPHGLMIASEDTEALDILERMIADLTPGQRISSKLFYLKNSFCKDVADVLKDIFRDGESSTKQPNPYMDDMYYYYRYGAGSRESTKERGRLSKRKQLKFVPEPTTNTILVLGADPGQLAEVERLIKVYDEGIRPDSNSVRTTRQLAFRYTTAKEVADVIKDVFRDLLSPNDKSMNRGGQPQQQEQSKAMYSTTYIFGGDSDKDNARKFKGLLSLGIDDRSNTLIVSAPKDLMNIISTIADDLDRAAGESRNVVRVLNLGPTSGAVQQVLSGLGKPAASTAPAPSPEPQPEKPPPQRAGPARETTIVMPN